MDVATGILEVLGARPREVPLDLRHPRVLPRPFEDTDRNKDGVLTWDEVQAVLDEEVQRLSAPFRAAFVLCVLEGKTVPAAARELACKPGTVSSRLTPIE